MEKLRDGSGQHVLWNEDEGGEDGCDAREKRAANMRDDLDYRRSFPTKHRVDETCPYVLRWWNFDCDIGI